MRGTGLCLALIFLEWVLTSFTVMSVLLGREPLQWVLLIVPSFIASMAATLLFVSCNAAQAAVDAVSQ